MFGKQGWIGLLVWYDPPIKRYILFTSMINRIKYCLHQLDDNMHIGVLETLQLYKVFGVFTCHQLYHSFAVKDFPQEALVQYMLVWYCLRCFNLANQICWFGHGNTIYHAQLNLTTVGNKMPHTSPSISCFKTGYYIFHMENE